MTENSIRDRWYQPFFASSRWSCSAQMPNFLLITALSTMAKSILTLLLLPLIVCGQQIPVIDRATFTSPKMSIPGKIVLEEHIGTFILNISYTVPYFDLNNEIPYTTTVYQ